MKRGEKEQTCLDSVRNILRTKKCNKYLDEEVRWGEYLDMKISQFYDEDGYPTYSYAVEYKFTDYLDGIKYVLKVFGIAAAVCAFIVGIIVGFYIIYSSAV